MNETLHNMMKGLTLHYLHQHTAAEAIEQGKTAGVAKEILESLPGMMFEITSAAGAIFGGGRDLDEVVDEVTKRTLASGNTDNFHRRDAMALVKTTIKFLEALTKQYGSDNPLPKMTGFWYNYGTKKKPNTPKG